MIEASFVDFHWAGGCNACDHGNRYDKVWEIKMGSYYANKLVIRLCSFCFEELKNSTAISKKRKKKK